MSQLTCTFSPAAPAHKRERFQGNEGTPFIHATSQHTICGWDLRTGRPGYVDVKNIMIGTEFQINKSLRKGLVRHVSPPLDASIYKHSLTISQLFSTSAQALRVGSSFVRMHRLRPLSRSPRYHSLENIHFVS